MTANRVALAKGFSLIEIMVVLVIIGTMAMITVVSFTPSSEDDRLEKEARRFQQVFDLAVDFAVLNQQQLGLRIEPEDNQYLFLFLDDEQKWQPITNQQLFTSQTLHEDLGLELQLDGLPWINEDELFDQSVFDEELSVSDEETQIGEEEEELQEPPQIFIFSSGEFTPFSLIFKFEPLYGPAEVAYFRVNGVDFPPLELEGPLDSI
ncbi:MAG: type II secretion system minor pseudopilin GspH [Aestuariibacter sp.]